MEQDINNILEIDPSPDAPTPQDSTATPENIGGWLYVPAIGFVLGGIFSVVGIFISLGVISDLPNRYQGVFAVNILFEMGVFVFFIYAAIRFFGKRRNAPATIIALMLIGIAVSGLLLLINIGADAEPFAIESGKQLVQGIISAAIWIPYFRVSKRVKRTFVVP